MVISQVDVLLRVVSVLERLGILYVVGGSYASSARGIARATMDIDLLVAMRPDQGQTLATELGPEFYADEQAITRAVAAKRHFNVIHIETAFKVDIFIAQGGGFDEKQLERRQLEVVDDEKQQTAYVSTAEDIVLAKLRWYRMSNETSERQWRDILGVIEVQGDKLDLDYMRHWAQALGVADLLEQALDEAKRKA